LHSAAAAVLNNAVM